MLPISMYKITHFQGKPVEIVETNYYICICYIIVKKGISYDLCKSQSIGFLLLYFILFFLRSKEGKRGFTFLAREQTAVLSEISFSLSSGRANLPRVKERIINELREEKLKIFRL